MQTFYGIQALRAVAALGVVVFHAAPRGQASFALGMAGVDIFFVISGFIMWTITRRGTTPAAFMVDRVYRIVPLYWLATLVLALGTLLSLFPRMHVSASALVTSLFFIPHLSESVPGEIYPILAQGWTLNYEMFFYLIFAGFLLFSRTVQGIGLIGVLSSLVVLGVALSPDNDQFRFWTNSIVLEFAYGVAIGWCVSAGCLRGRALGLALIAGAVAGFAAVGVLGWSAPRALVFGLPSLLLVAGVVALELGGATLAFRPLTVIGDASYSIYLFHTFAISVAFKLFGGLSGAAAIAFAIAASIAAGVAVHLAVERPLARLKPRKARAPAAGATPPQPVGAERS
ncbi:acyltransferase family protein [Blastochloris viridis]|uniref:Exopolysaccharide production protein ExoZ n=1 Tax=Blastochloris viridis TaxID=1079 RepID=A0A0H5BCL2_BLAVI|nr:acyltransferase [Blastochloris viridis]ALK08670.1 O-acetyltransferase OatA [Blastochloris viridis]BAR98036.1 exopolysaccharide production protein ExoZ [Blastochloris viridis]CUU41333.1 O-acetyltransferase OatA [Blastochloris viridis]